MRIPFGGRSGSTGQQLMRSLLGILLVLGWGLATARGEIRIDFAMDSDPDVVPPEQVMVFPDTLLPLWRQALARPEADSQRLAAESIAGAAQRKYADFQEVKPELVKLLSAEQVHPATSFAVARALIALEAQDAAAVLFEASQRQGSELRQLVEPALAKWKFPPARTLWLKRLATNGTPLRELVLAIRCLRAAEEDSAVEPLLVIAHDSFRPHAARLEAARSAGALRASGLEPNAQRFLDGTSPSILNRLCAAAVLDQHRTPAARELLTRLAQDSEPSIAAAALTSLNADDPSLVLPLAEQAIRNNDAKVRQQGVNAFVARPTPERVTAIGRLLDDPHPSVRASVRESLFQLARTAELDAPIRAVSSEVLAGDGWRGQEQAALLLGALDHKPAAPRLVALLESSRGEVMVASAWGLRKLAIPETLPAMLDKATRQTVIRKQPEPPDALDDQVGLLFEAMGQMKYAPCESLLRQYIPKDYTMGEKSRGAAIWTLGLLHAGQPDEELAKLLFARMVDPSNSPEEMGRVRVMSLVSIARMQAKSQLEPIRKHFAPHYRPTPLIMAYRWAMKELAGKELPLPKPVVFQRFGWFLEPLRPQESAD